MPKLLLIEDDITIRDMLTEYLRGEGFETASAAGQAEARECMRTQTFDLVLLDIMLSDGSGFGVCADAKALKLPVIFLTASADENSVVTGLDMGADDYIVKPFRPRELISRIRSVLRRSAGVSPIVALGDLIIDAEKGIVTKNGNPVNLSALEFKLLLTLVGRRGKLVTRTGLLEDIWDAGGDFVNDNTLTVYVKRLREKIEDDPHDPRIIRTVRGIGYRID